MVAQPSLRGSAPWRVLDGFGSAQRAASRYARPGSVEELSGLLQRAAADGLQVAFRGSGRSYGDAALSAGQLVIDNRGMSRVLAFDPATGVLEAEAGVTIEDLWRTGLPHGYWPYVVPGTMFPTMGGCIAMNIHGKNCYKAGPFGDHVRELDLLTAAGELKTLSREREPGLFRAVVAGLGLLGAVTRVKLELKKVETGRLRVRPVRTPHLAAMFEYFDARIAAKDAPDYLVGWIDCFAGGAALGRGLIHEASYQGAAEDPAGASMFDVAKQGLPPSIFGVPRSVMWRFMKLFTNDPGVRLINTAKYLMPETFGGDGTFRETHVAFAFLLDYVPDWRKMYGDAGFIQYQVFAPNSTARTILPAVLEHCRRRGVVSYLGVFKRHRPDEFLLSHGLDGWSLALDFPVNAREPQKLRDVTRELTEMVLDAGGRFYAAKDSVLTAAQFARAYGERYEEFRTLRRRMDPRGLFGSDQARRLGLLDG